MEVSPTRTLPGEAAPPASPRCRRRDPPGVPGHVREARSDTPRVGRRARRWIRRSGSPRWDEDCRSRGSRAATSARLPPPSRRTARASRAAAATPTAGRAAAARCSRGKRPAGSARRPCQRPARGARGEPRRSDEKDLVGSPSPGVLPIARSARGNASSARDRRASSPEPRRLLFAPAPPPDTSARCSAARQHPQE